MGSRWTLLLYLFSMLLILTGLTEAEEATVATYADDEKGTCHYELKIPAVSCQQCKCESDTSTTDAVRELEKRLNAMERQIQQITTMVPPDYEISDYSTTPFSSIIENDDPYASPVFNGEGVSIQELLSSSPEYDEPSPPVPSPKKRLTDGTPGIKREATIAKVNDDIPVVNSPGHSGQIEAAPGYEELLTVTELTTLEEQLPLYPNQATDFQPVTDDGDTQSREVEHFFVEKTGDNSGATEAEDASRPSEGSREPLAADRGIVSGRAASDPHAPYKASPVTRKPLVGDDTGKAGLEKKKPQWKLHDRPSAVDRPPDSRSAPSAPREPLGRAGANCMDGCSCLRVWGYWQDGVYAVSNPPGSGKKGESVLAYCDMSTDGGAWTVIQNRKDGSRNFYRQWSSYASGFGRLESDFWLGNDMLYGLTTRIPYQLRVEFSDWDGEQGYAVYDRFVVGSPDDKYRLVLGEYVAGNRGNSLSYHNSSLFSTHDQDNDASAEMSCAKLRQAGFWFKACNQANPNGRYIHGPDAGGLNGGVITWGTWGGHGFTYALKTFRMMIRPVHYDRILYY